MARVTVFVGDAHAAREALADRVRATPGVPVHETAAAGWTFSRSIGSGCPAHGQLVLLATRLEDAFPAGQSGSTRLVLTHSAYQLQRWLDWMERRGDVSLLASADATALRHAAPEAFQRRGPWARIDVIEVPGRGGSAAAASADEGSPLRLAFTTSDPGERLALCRREADARGDDAVVLLALGSAYMEVQDLDAAQAAIEGAVVRAPDWEAAQYELGKLFLRRDDLERASETFAEAGRLMPAFSAAFSNLGAALGELDRTGEALAAFEQALRYDPNGYTVLNNIGVVSRELGRLHESEAAFRRVVSLAPEFVFGHYNLGHTLFLQGRYRAALSAYVEGQRRDPEKNARQACRLAVVRLAAGDAEGSLREIQRCTASLPRDQKREILMEAQEILWALLTDQPALAGWRTVSDAVTAELSKI